MNHVLKAVDGLWLIAEVTFALLAMTLVSLGFAYGAFVVSHRFEHGAWVGDPEGWPESWAFLAFVLLVSSVGLLWVKGVLA